ncbi:TPA: hypothetical protein NKU34_004463 [Vibrio parahaemolyticus]|uniref:hypothetical protein n=1 Tax=Vibrio parahaemolyticus TaxID=670 RepID=UPI00226B7E54|nr:hypothetical protein [Vibrio parahaemolyticus]MCX8773835.1 hypothetical protein [Vibrio parahaemolyticus]HCH3381821.1 hypothetical protein [Vibrio parahaemolyticus]HCM1502407.1 hypothetical protein [Vibrio parahaemolyticus]
MYTINVTEQQEEELILLVESEFKGKYLRHSIEYSEQQGLLEALVRLSIDKKGVDELHYEYRKSNESPSKFFWYRLDLNVT